MLFTIREIIDLIIMTFAIGYIFSSFIERKPQSGYDPLTYYNKPSIIEEIKQGIIVAAPAIVLHELAHKFSAMAFGAIAIVKAPINWYLIVIVMKLINFPLLFFVGGYVIHSPLPPLQSSIVAIAGPLVNLILYLLSLAVVKYNFVNKKHFRMIMIAGKLNLFLFAFNMIPLPGFDGFNFFSNLFKFLF